jgi:DnaB-like helicase N terminal domain.
LTANSNSKNQSNGNSKSDKAETGVIYYLIQNPDEFPYILSNVSEKDFKNAENANIFKALSEKMSKSTDFDVMLLQSELTTKEMGKLTKMLTLNKSIIINKQVLNDYIEIIKNDEAKTVSAKNLSDDDFLQLAEKLKERK